MNYIVFDLEWNQPDDGIPSSERKLLFEIIEIGAVKLNENLQMVSKFNELIKPTVYHKINWHTKKMLGLKKNELDSGERFPKVCKRFLEWCGEDVIFCSWGSQDLTELQRNMEYFHFPPLSDGPIPYYNLQKIFGRITGDEVNQKNLEAAVEMMKIPKAVPFHRAYSDAYYTAQVMRKLGMKDIKDDFSYDLYHIPETEKDEIHAFNGVEYYFVSRGYADREKLANNRKVLQIRCVKCNRAIRAKVRWFPTSTKILHSVAVCEEHGAIRGKLKFKKDQRDLYYADKVLTYVPMEEVEQIKLKKASTKKKKSANKDIINKEITNKDIANKDIANKDIANKDAVNKTLADKIITNKTSANINSADKDTANNKTKNNKTRNDKIKNNEKKNRKQKNKQ